MVNITLQEAAVRLSSLLFKRGISLLVYARAPSNSFHCRLDLNEIINDVTTKTSEASFYADSSPAPARPSEVSSLRMLQLFLVAISLNSCNVPVQSKEANGSAKSSRGRPAKKPKTEVGSKNIKDMFRRVTRSGSGS
jgi:ribonuclease H2 subunit B